MSALVTQQMMAQTLAQADIRESNPSPGPGALASPSYWAVESCSVVAGESFVKRMHPEVIGEFNLGSAMQLATQAGTCGAGPRVDWCDVATGAIAMEALVDGWKTATQADLQISTNSASIVAAMQRLHATPTLAARFDAFQEIDKSLARFVQSETPLPDDIGWIRRVLGEYEFLRESGELVPCRNDGSASNIMIHTSSKVLLVDYDRAGMNDPLYDLGCLMWETTDCEHEMKPLYTLYCGEFNEAGFARARLWSCVDDLLHGLWARLLSFHSVRTSIEWLKYSEWRLLRLRMMLTHPDHAERLGLAREAS